MSDLSRTRSLICHLGAVTPLGWTVAVVAVAAWAAGVVLGWEELLIISATSVALLVMAGVSMIGKLDLSSELTVKPARVVVGERAAGSILMTNRSGRRSHAVRVELPVGASAAIFDVPRLASQGTYDELFVVPTSRRAIIPVGPITTVQGDALGLVRRTRTWSDRYEIFVHPDTKPLETMAAGLVRDLEGQTTNHLTNSDVAFHTLRDYVPGDDRRHVHWKTSARLGQLAAKPDQLMVRQYVDTRRSHVCVLLSTDTGDYATDDEFELAVSAAASLATQAMRDEQTLTVIVGAEEWRTVHFKPLLDRFSGVEMDTGMGGVDECFATARRIAPEASVTTAVVGSTPTVAAVRRAASRVPLETKVVAVQCHHEMACAYRMVGSAAFVRIGKLADLRRGLMAVV